MTSPLTDSQERMLRHFKFGGSIDGPRTAWAPIRRLFMRGLIGRTIRRGGRQYYKITDAGHRVLAQTEDLV